MTPIRLTCPHCHEQIRLPAVLPAAFTPKCPHCEKPVTIPKQNGDSPPRDRVDEVPEEPSRADPIAAFGIIAGTLFLLVAMAGGLLAVCLSNDDAPAPVAAVADEPDDAPAPTPVRRKPVAKKLASATAIFALTPREENKVNAATQAGIAYLKSKQIKRGPETGSWNVGLTEVGVTALAGLTLLEAGEPRDDPAVREAADYIRAHIGEPGQTYENYAVALSVLFLARLDDRSDVPLVRSLALRLAAAQHATGGWSYDCFALRPAQEIELRERLKHKPEAPATEIGKDDPSTIGHAFPIANYGRRPIGGFSVADNSNTQFSLLALWAARRYFDPHELDRPLRLVAKRFQESQSPGGTWGYAVGRPDVSQYPTMTAAGLLGLAVGFGLDFEAEGGDTEKGLKMGTDLAQNHALQAGLRALAQKVGLPGIDTTVPHEMYFLWSVERVAVLYGLARIEGKDWYRWGLEFLLANQQKDGEWMMGRGPGSNDIVDTCFALLFLQRVNLTSDLTEKIEALIAALAQLQRKK